MAQGIKADDAPWASGITDFINGVGNVVDTVGTRGLDIAERFFAFKELKNDTQAKKQENLNAPSDGLSGLFSGENGSKNTMLLIGAVVLGAVLLLGRD